VKRARSMACRLADSRLVPAFAALLVLTGPVAACPYCALSQGTDTLIYIMGFLIIPYVIVTGTFMWMRRVLRDEAAELSAAGGAQPAGTSSAGASSIDGPSSDDDHRSA